MNTVKQYILEDLDNLTGKEIGKVYKYIRTHLIADLNLPDPIPERDLLEYCNERMSKTKLSLVRHELELLVQKFKALQEAQEIYKPKMIWGLLEHGSTFAKGDEMWDTNYHEWKPIPEQWLDKSFEPAGTTMERFNIQIRRKL